MTCEGMSTGRLLPAAGPLTENARRLIYSKIKKQFIKHQYREPNQRPPWFVLVRGMVCW